MQTLGRDEGHIIKSSELTLTLTDPADFGVYFCVVRNSTAQFNVMEYSKKQMIYFSCLILSTWILYNAFIFFIHLSLQML